MLNGAEGTTHLLVAERIIRFVIYFGLVFYRGKQWSPVVSGLVETVDKVMVHMVSKLQSSSDTMAPLAIGGKSSVAGQYTLQNTSSTSISRISVLKKFTLPPLPLHSWLAWSMWSVSKYAQRGTHTLSTAWMQHKGCVSQCTIRPELRNLKFEIWNMTWKT